MIQQPSSMNPPLSDAEVRAQRRSTRRDRWPLRLFSSIWLGVSLLILLFLYSSIGSALAPVREMPGLEMTEFEWFHWWPFDLLIALICINLTVATIRRIPFKPINYGVWMIHTGIIILALGSVWYFSTKLEGEALLPRRTIVVQTHEHGPVRMAIRIGNRVTLGEGDDAYTVTVQSTDPDWELLSGDDKGERTYSINLLVQHGGERFIRQVIADFPQYTEDVLFTNDPQQPMQRARRVTGEPIVDADLQVSLERQPVEHFYLTHDTALYVREVYADGTAEPWAVRSIHDLPRFHDYVASMEDVWWPIGEQQPPLRPLSIDVEPATVQSNRVATSEPFRIAQYLRYATTDARRVPGGDAFNPAAEIEILRDGRTIEHDTLVALDPQQNTAMNGLLGFRWINDASELDALQREPVLQVEIPGKDFRETFTIRETSGQCPDARYQPLGDTGYAYRVRQLEDGLEIRPGEVASLAIIDVQSPEGEFARMVFAGDDARSIDMPADESAMHSQPLPPREDIAFRYTPGSPRMLIGGPGESELRMLTPACREPARLEAIEIGEVIPFRSEMSFRVNRFAAKTLVRTKPRVIPPVQRNLNAANLFSMIAVEFEGEHAVEQVWLPFHLFVFDHELEAPRRFRFEPKRITLKNGTQLELVFGRTRMSLPAQVALNDFEVASHVGGFSGSQGSIRNWTSELLFDPENAAEKARVSVNEPGEFDGYWFFQAQWDPPEPPRSEDDPGSRGMNYTVLGVGNRNGVNVMLFGCCVAVIGMIYAFYFKPYLKRRKREQVHASLDRELAAEREGVGAQHAEPVLAGAFDDDAGESSASAWTEETS